MIAYIIKTTACALLLYAIYILLLERENMHRFKRIYLPASLVFSLIAPFIVLTVKVSQMPENIGSFYAGRTELVEIADSQPFIVEAVTQEETTTLASTDYVRMLLFVYMLIGSLFLLRLFKNCWQMLARGRKYACMDYHGARIALINEKYVPHSFGSYIFINREDYNNGRIADAIIAHEWTHVWQRHTLAIIISSRCCMDSLL